eukprot:322561-Chlamydomonas_euryale.AAC.22
MARLCLSTALPDSQGLLGRLHTCMQAGSCACMQVTDAHASSPGSPTHPDWVFMHADYVCPHGLCTYTGPTYTIKLRHRPYLIHVLAGRKRLRQGACMLCFINPTCMDDAGSSGVCCAVMH